MARGDVVIVNFPIPSHRGHEQIGTRPALVIQSNVNTSSLPTEMIVPFTSNQQAMRFPYTILVNPSQQNGLSDPSVLLVFQLRAIDKNRILRTIGQLESSYINQLDNMVTDLLGY